MKKNIKYVLTTFMIAFVLTGCSGASDSSKETTPTLTPSPTISESPEEATTDPILDVLTPAKAKEMMDASTDYILLDVRTSEEYEEGHIENALLLPYDEISTNTIELLPDKSTTLFLYCRSGRRSAIAAKALSELGYTTVYDFGGIIDWPYDIVTN